ncbi:MAG: UTP--glucose-1-phosphate uridylyltransferase GalU [Coriobacteriia bacterium]
MKAIIPAAGLGTRFLPVTKSQPKEMLPVVDKPVIQYVIEEAVSGGASQILIVTGRGKRAIEDHFDRSVELEMELETCGKNGELEKVRAISELAEVFYVRQKTPRGLGHAVLCGAALSNHEPFFVLLGDVLVPNADILPRLREVHERTGGSVIAVIPVPAEQVSRYGVIAGEQLGDGEWRVTGLVEKPPAEEAPSNLAIFGRYLLTPRVMEILPTVEPGRGGEIQLTDALVELLKDEPIHAVVVEPDAGYDTGNVLAWLEANIALALKSEEYGPALRERLREMFGTERD